VRERERNKERGGTENRDIQLEEENIFFWKIYAFSLFPRFSLSRVIIAVNKPEINQGLGPIL
jgi:hypothetical protein